MYHLVRIRLVYWISLFVLGLSVLHAADYTPVSPNPIVEHSAYSLGYNEDHDQATWVAYTLTGAQATSKLYERTDIFRDDPAVVTGSATLADYKGSGYDRGHLAPARDMTWSRTAMSESFYMSNMSPQIPGFNRGIWKQLESQVRQYAVDRGLIYRDGTCIGIRFAKNRNERCLSPTQVLQSDFRSRRRRCWHDRIPHAKCEI